MYKLAIDTSSPTLSLALFKNEECLASQNVELNQQHGQAALPQVAHLLENQGLSPKEIEELLIGIGPGSYTGLRVGVAIAKVWSHSLAIRLRTMSSLALMAAASREGEGLLIPIIDARRLSAYLAGYCLEKGQLRALIAESHSDWQTWLGQHQELLNGQNKLILIGKNISDFVQCYQAAYPELAKKTKVLDQASMFPDCQYALKVPTVLCEEVDTLVPNYLQVTLAEREWLEKNNGEDTVENLVELINQ